MPIALKEWAVTVRALSEGEQLLTLVAGDGPAADLEHETFFLYPTFEHEKNDLVREAHHPELTRALEEGVWPDEEPAPRDLLRDGGIAQPDRVRIRAWAELAGRVTVTNPRVVDGLSTCCCSGFTGSPDRSRSGSAKRRGPIPCGSRSSATCPSRAPR